MTHSIRRSIRSAVEATGHQIRKTDVYSSQKLRYRRLFSLLDLNLILDVGANAGQFATLCRTIGYRGNILSFEPSSTAYQKLLAAASSDPLWTVAGIALGATTGETEINVSADSFCSSILPMLDSHLSAAPRSGYLHKEKVSIRRLDDVLPPPPSPAARSSNSTSRASSSRSSPEPPKSSRKPSPYNWKCLSSPLPGRNPDARDVRGHVRARLPALGSRTLLPRPRQRQTPSSRRHLRPRHSNRIRPSPKSPSPFPAQNSPPPSKLNPCVESLDTLVLSLSSPSLLKAFAASSTAVTTPPASP
ncbi:FkbM family methyltransferase [Tunturiibacter gelidiferens]|uniref:FkbM family methyltransferase n=1 Tax=Tunturiibacter gelidiferens TaxID=3069689 RepID=UPI003D9B4497